MKRNLCNRPNTSTPSGHWANWDGQVRRMVSTVAGNSSAALAGPYVDMGVVLDSEPRGARAVEGLQGTDSVNTYQVRRSMHQDCLLKPRNFVFYPFFTHFPPFFAHFQRLDARNPENTTRSPGENGKKSRKIGENGGN